MASQTNIRDTTYLEDCINKKKEVLDVYEDLGLFSEKVRQGQDPEFPQEAANSLQTKIKEIAATFRVAYRNEKESMLADLGKEDAFAESLQELGQRYGSTLWGNARSPIWDWTKDRNT